jgi:hypothetical protein
MLLHPREDAGRARPAGRRRLSTVGHREAFLAFVRAARRAGIRFMVIGCTFRDIAVRAASPRDIDVVLVDHDALPSAAMESAGFTAGRGVPHAWRYGVRGREVELQVAAVASSSAPAALSRWRIGSRRRRPSKGSGSRCRASRTTSS